MTAAEPVASVSSSPNVDQTVAPNTDTLVVSAIGIRRAVGWSGFLLPVGLLLGGYLCGVPVQDNISSYYHTPLRDLLVGTLSAMAVFLFCYRGNDWIENWTANVGSFAALAVAFFPLDAASDPLHQRSLVGYLHSVAGGVFFVTLAFYSLYHFPRRETASATSTERNLVYRLSGIAILIAMMAMGAYLFLLPPDWKSIANRYNALFWLESLAAWCFAGAWLTKGKIIVAELAIETLHRSRKILLPGTVHSR